MRFFKTPRGEVGIKTNTFYYLYQEPDSIRVYGYNETVVIPIHNFNEKTVGGLEWHLRNLPAMPDDATYEVIQISDIEEDIAT